jgi:protoporphyrinogen oxidase
MTGSSRLPVVILGAGPAGLAAAFKLAQRRHLDVTVLERAGAVGGNAGSFELEGVRVDYGSHRLHPACAPEILADIRAMLGTDLLDRPRHGRIRLRSRWVHFPLKPLDLMFSLPPSFAFGTLRDAIRRRRLEPGMETFATVLEKGLGPTICREFYFPYAEKIWGISAEEIDPEQARRRVSAGSISRLLMKVMRGLLGTGSKSGKRFFYPREGFGQISESYYRAAADAGARVELRTTALGIEMRDRGAEVTISGPNGKKKLTAQLVLSTIPLPALALTLAPPAPRTVSESIAALRYRSMVLVYLVLETDRFTEYDAHYFPGRDVAITRLSEPLNYADRTADGTTVLCAEIPCNIDDRIWSADEQSLGQLVLDVLTQAGIPNRAPVRQVVIRRLSHAYPIYTLGYQEHFDVIDSWISDIDGLLSFGRQGLFVHDNTHHTIAMAYAANECIGDDGRVDRELWDDYRRRFESHVVED